MEGGEWGRLRGALGTSQWILGFGIELTDEQDRCTKWTALKTVYNTGIGSMAEEKPPGTDADGILGSSK